MKKPTLYFDTSIISAYWYAGADVAMLARRMHTREWWELEEAVQLVGFHVRRGGITGRDLPKAT